MSLNSNIIDKVIKDLTSEQLIPYRAVFDITELHLEAYMKLYLFHRANRSQRVVSDVGKLQQQYMYARKLAALTLIKLKLDRGARASEIKEGFVYTIVNPAWPSHLKIGMSINAKERLDSYQTYSPFRDYKITNYEFVFNRRESEKEVKKLFNISLESGEWFRDIDALKVMEHLRKDIPVKPSWIF